MFQIFRISMRKEECGGNTTKLFFTSKQTHYFYKLITKLFG